MSRRITWLGAAMVLCFVVLFLQLNNIEVVKAKQYATSSSNPANAVQTYDQPRGIIQSADGVVLAQSVRTQKGSYFKYERQYPLGPLFAQITGFLSFDKGSTGVEEVYGADLTAHNRPVKTIGDLLTTPVVTDNVTLTVSTTLQRDAQQALGGRNGAIVMLDPSTGAVLAMYANPTYDPNPLAANSTAEEDSAWTADNTDVPGTDFTPLTSLAYQDHFPPGSTFKVVTTAAAYTYAPKLVTTPIPVFSCIPGGYFEGQGVGAPLCNDGDVPCGGTIAEMLPPSCDPGYAILGTRIGATGMQAEAQSFGFNQQPPIDLTPSPYEVSDFLQASCWGGHQVFLAYSSIGQDCTIASPLQMAMVAEGIANGGVVMTPHVMYEIHDSQNNLVERYQPKPWHVATSQATAAAITGLMENVVKVGTAAGDGFPASEQVAAKTGTAQVGLLNSLTTDWMIAFAPASAPKVAIAVAMPNQPRDETGALVAGPIVKKMLADALAAGQ
ncbi:MAG TPA: penicillin-binding transpeptidase domain-containing protein [Acidimicrobiales bacterium]|nr:penicillin-binding transpeptidase domain-containing protein [Acidimicrobiales bacterium]